MHRPKPTSIYPYPYKSTHTPSLIYPFIYLSQFYLCLYLYVLHTSSLWDIFKVKLENAASQETRQILRMMVDMIGFWVSGVLWLRFLVREFRVQSLGGVGFRAC